MHTLSTEELESMLDRAAARAAKEALVAVGLHDENAANDIRQIRSLLDAWKDTRKSIWSTFVKLSTVALLTFIAGAVWMSINRG